MSTLALIQAAVAAQGPASTAGAAIQAAIAADSALNADLQANGPAVLVDTSQTPPVVTCYSAASVANPYISSAIYPGEIIGGNVNPLPTYTATIIRVAS